MQDIDTWLHDSGHWESFWNKTVRLLDGSLSFKKNSFISLQDYFQVNKLRMNAIDEQFAQFNVPNIKSQKLKWVNIDTNTKAKLKIKDSINAKKYKFKWPQIPQERSDGTNEIDYGQDWRLPLTLKFFNSLNEPHKSYFLTSALYTPEKNLIAPTFETTARGAAEKGPIGSPHMAQNSTMADIVADVEHNPIDRKSERKKKRKKEREKKKNRDKDKDKNKDKDDYKDDLNVPIGAKENAPNSPASGSGSPSPSVKLPQARTSSVLDTAAILEDAPKPLAPPKMDSEPSTEEAQQLQKQLMAEAFKKFQAKKKAQESQRALALANANANPAPSVPPEPEPSAPSAPSAPPEPEPEPEEENKEDDIPIYRDEEIMFPPPAAGDDEYKISAPPNQRAMSRKKLPGMAMVNNPSGGGDVTPPTFGDNGGGDVTPPIPDEPFFITSPSLSTEFDRNDSMNVVAPDSRHGSYINKNGYGSSRKNYNPNRLTSSLNKKRDSASGMGGRRVSKAYHGYQPSWAQNKLATQFSYYNNGGNMFDNMGYSEYTRPYSNSIYADGDSDDEIDDELDYRKQKQQPRKSEKQFSRKYVDANRNQSIMRYQDILDQSKKAVSSIQQQSKRVSELDNIQQSEDDFAPYLLEPDAPIIEQRRGSKYSTQNDFNFAKKNINNNLNNNDQNGYNGYNGGRDRGLSVGSAYSNNGNNYSAAIQRHGSVASSVSSAQSSYSSKKAFGTKRNKKKGSKGNMLKRMFQWGGK